QESGVAFHMFHHLSVAIEFSTTPQTYGLDMLEKALLRSIDRHFRPHKMSLRAALKRRPFCFRPRGCEASAPMRASRPASTQQVKAAMSNSATSHLLPVFARVDLGFTHGEGCWLTATNGDRYLDFTSGVAVNALGHAHPHLVAALQEQATKLWHMSNLFKSPDGEKLAARLCAESFADFVFF